MSFSTFFPNDERARKLARHTTLLSEFLVGHREHLRLPDLHGQRIVVHGHCHQKAMGSMNAEMDLLRQTGADTSAAQLRMLRYGRAVRVEKEKYPVSQTLAERALLPAVRGAASDTILVSDGFSCREQIAQNTPRRAVHVAEVLAG